MKPQHLAFAFLIAIMAGTNWVGTKISVDYFPPLFVVAMRFLFLIVLFLPFLRIVRGQMRTVFAVGISLGVMQFGFMFLSLSLSTDVATLAVVNQLYVPISTILAVVVLHEKVGWRRWSAIAIAFAGVLVMGFDPQSLNQLPALAVVGLSACSLSLSSLFMRKLTGVPVWQLQAWIAVFAAPSMLALSFLFEDGQLAALQSAPWEGWAAYAYGIVAGSLFFHAGWYYLLRRYPVSMVTPIMLMQPVVGVLSGVLVYGDRLTGQLLIGGVLTMVGVAIIVFRSERHSGEVDFDKVPATPPSAETARNA